MCFVSYTGPARVSRVTLINDSRVTHPGLIQCGERGRVRGGRGEERERKSDGKAGREPGERKRQGWERKGESDRGRGKERA